MTSSDGFCSTLTFAPGELGQLYEEEVPSARRSFLSGSAISSSQNTPMATPTAIAPPSPFPTSHHRTSSNPMIAPSPPAAHINTFRPSSPTRSNSTSSVATQSSYAQPAQGTIISNPTPMSSSLPSIAAAKSSVVPMTTPPQTPQSTTGSVSGLKRDASESEREDGGNEKKKRRIAPSQITTLNSN
jgi:chromatin assembly factor 1 subunit B